MTIMEMAILCLHVSLNSIQINYLIMVKDHAIGLTFSSELLVSL